MHCLFHVSLHCGPVVDFTTLHPFDLTAPDGSKQPSILLVQEQLELCVCVCVCRYH